MPEPRIKSSSCTSRSNEQSLKIHLFVDLLPLLLKLVLYQSTVYTSPFKELCVVALLHHGALCKQKRESSESFR